MRDRTPGQVQHRAGFTLLEILVVVLILAIVAQVALVSTSPVRTFALDQATEQVIQALRFAQQEALRSRTTTVVSFDTQNRKISVYQPNYATVPAGKTLVTHPVEKRPYVVELGPRALSDTVIGLAAKFKFEDGLEAEEVGFDGNGRPGKPLSESSFSPLTLNPYVWRGHWQANNFPYSANDLVEYKGSDYIALSNHNSSNTFEMDLVKFWSLRPDPVGMSAWAAGASYSKGNNVRYSGRAYTALANHVSSSSFDSDLSAGYWTALPLPISVTAGVYSSSISITPHTGFLRKHVQK